MKGGSPKHHKKPGVLPFPRTSTPAALRHKLTWTLISKLNGLKEKKKNLVKFAQPILMKRIRDRNLAVISVCAWENHY